MAYGKIQTITTFSDNSDYSEPIIRHTHTTTLASPTEAITFRGQAGPFSQNLQDGVRSLVPATGVVDAVSMSIGTVQQSLFTNRSSSTTIYLQTATKLSSASSLVVNIDADGGEGSYASMTRNTGSWTFATQYFAASGLYLQFSAAPSGANSAKGGDGKSVYLITSASDTVLQLANTGFSDSTGETVSIDFLSLGVIAVAAGQQVILAGSHPTTAGFEGNFWGCWTSTGTADFDFTIMGTT